MCPSSTSYYTNSVRPFRIETHSNYNLLVYNLFLLLCRSKRAALHISNDCFVSFGVAIVFPYNSIYSARLSGDIRRIFQSGLIDKIFDEVRFEIQRSPSGKLLAAGEGTLRIVSAEEKGLTLEDTQGMFLLLGAGFLIAATALLSEWMGGFTRKCRFKRNVTPASAISKKQFISKQENNKADDLKIIDGTDNLPNFGSRPSTVDSRDSLDGKIINVTEENILVHDNLVAKNKFDSRRSISVEIDREVQDIFEQDQNRRRKFYVETVVDLK